MLKVISYIKNLKLLLYKRYTRSRGAGTPDTYLSSFGYFPRSFIFTPLLLLPLSLLPLSLPPLSLLPLSSEHPQSPFPVYGFRSSSRQHLLLFIIRTLNKYIYQKLGTS